MFLLLRRDLVLLKIKKMKINVLILVFSLFLISCKSSKTIIESNNLDDVLILPLVDTKPMFNGKAFEDGFREYIYQNVKYPTEAIKSSISGTVMVQFVIEKDGSVSNAKVIKSAHKLLDNEALRVIKQSPNWTPASKEHEQVRVQINFPVTFRNLGIFDL